MYTHLSHNFFKLGQGYRLTEFVRCTDFIYFVLDFFEKYFNF